jgi:DNA-binding NtrC family response regulator
MPAPVLVAHDDKATRDLAVAALGAAGIETVGFDDPIAALDAIEANSRVRVLVTRVDFGTGKLNGVALARMLRVKRPGAKILFLALPSNAHHTEGEGEFMPMPLVEPYLLVETVSKLLVPD